VIKHLWIVALMLLSSCSDKTTAPPERAPAGEAAMPAAPSPSVSAAPLPDPLPEIAARVNGQPIFLRSVRLVAGLRMSGDASEEPRPVVYRKALNSLITRELLLQEALVRKVEPDTDGIERAYDEARVPYKDDESWKVFLAQQEMDPQSFRQELRIQHTVQALMTREAAGLPPVSDQEARSFYESRPELFETGERLRASHIQIRAPEGLTTSDRARLREKADALLVRLRKGEDFAKLARQHSEDPGSAQKGGELQVFYQGQMFPAFERAAFALEPGQVSEVTETPFGYHIIKLHERLPSLRVEFEATMERVKQFVAAQRRQQAVLQLVSTLEARAKIETYL
jgi:peptidyl-prolyl cis-trans isomerase C